MTQIVLISFYVSPKSTLNQHCFHIFYDRVGEHDTRRREGSEAEYRVKRVYQHPSYQRPTSLNNDIAVFELEKPIQFNKYVQPVCLPDKNVAVGSDCYITGTLDQNEIRIYLIV